MSNNEKQTKRQWTAGLMEGVHLSSFLFLLVTLSHETNSIKYKIKTYPLVNYSLS